MLPPLTLITPAPQSTRPKHLRADRMPDRSLVAGRSRMRSPISEIPARSFLVAPAVAPVSSCLQVFRVYERIAGNLASDHSGTSIRVPDKSHESELRTSPDTNRSHPPGRRDAQGPPGMCSWGAPSKAVRADRRRASTPVAFPRCKRRTNSSTRNSPSHLLFGSMPKFHVSV